jgi:hypothetical protein
VETGHVTTGLFHPSAVCGENSFVFNLFHNKFTLNIEEVAVADTKFTELLMCSKV